MGRSRKGKKNKGEKEGKKKEERRKKGGKKEREERTGLLIDLQQLLINMIIYLKRKFKEILASKMFFLLLLF